MAAGSGISKISALRRLRVPREHIEEKEAMSGRDECVRDAERSPTCGETDDERMSYIEPFDEIDQSFDEFRAQTLQLLDEEHAILQPTSYRNPAQHLHKPSPFAPHR